MAKYNYIFKNFYLFAVFKSFWKNLGVEVLGEPEDAMLPEQYFYDSVYHLNRKGTELRTLKLIDELLLVQ